ncbi:MAG TPA: hypothetical protein VJI75_04410 [Candidatus Nanoarchaeia archaeon]|nr:hypothetical protein [Candidatus Nanoarchaeia archaeon]
MRENYSVYILNSREPYDLKERVLLAAKASGIEISCRFSSESMDQSGNLLLNGGFCELPSGHDLYLLHVSDVTERAVERLKEKQPWCRIVGISGAAFDITDSILPYFNKMVTRLGGLQKESLTEILQGLRTQQATSHENVSCAI